MDFITALLGYVAFLVGIIAFQSNKQKHIVLLKAFTDICFGVQYILLGAYTGAATDLVGCIRNLIFAKEFKRKSTQYIITAFFIAIMIAIGIVTWDGYLTLLAIAGKLCTTISFSIKNTKYLRLFTIPSGLMWIIYNAVTGSVGGVLYEAMVIVSIIIAAYRYDRKPKSGAPKLKNIER